MEMFQSEVENYYVIESMSDTYEIERLDDELQLLLKAHEISKNKHIWMKKSSKNDWDNS